MTRFSGRERGRSPYVLQCGGRRGTLARRLERFLNNDKYRFQGVELTAETRWVDELLLRAGYGYLHTEDRSSQWERDELQYRPEHKLTGEVKYGFDFGLSIYTSVMYLADQYYYSNTDQPIQRELGDYVVVDLKVDQEVIGDRWRLYAGADNLLDEDYEQSYGLPRAGRTVYAGTELSF